MTAAGAGPRPRVVDHLRVAWLVLATVLGVVPFALHVLVAPVVTPRARARLRRLLTGPAPRPDEPPAPDPTAWAGRTVFVVAGEASGDRLAARVVTALRRRTPELRVRGYGGPALAAAGAELDREITDHAVVGVWGVLASLPYWWRLCAETLARFRAEPPDLLLTVDFPGLNFRLARWARRHGIRTVHLVAPQTWAWAAWRTRRVRRAVDRLLVTFPFEPAIFRAEGFDTAYVGHPLFEAPLAAPRSTDRPLASAPVELRPGSRARDVRRQAPIVLAAAREIAARRPQTRFVARLASERGRPVFEALRAAARDLPPIEVEVGEPRRDAPVAASLTTSGTSTAELAVDLVPMVVFYRVSPLARLGKALFVTSPWFALPNLLAGRDAVPERLVGARGGARLGAELAGLLADDGRWRAQRDALEEVRARVAHGDVADRAARAILAP